MDSDWNQRAHEVCRIGKSASQKYSTQLYFRVFQFLTIHLIESRRLLPSMDV